MIPWRIGEPIRRSEEATPQRQAKSMPSKIQKTVTKGEERELTVTRRPEQWG